MAEYQFSADYVTPWNALWKVCLRDLIARPGIRMLEIGSFEGRSAIWFLDNILTGPDCSITCLDGFWPPYGEIFDGNLAASGRAGQVVKLTGKSEAALPTLDEASYDLIYIDGGHREDEVWFDGQEAWRLAKPGATLIFDDYEWGPELPMEERPKRAIDRFLALHEGQYGMRYKGYQVILKKSPVAVEG